MSDLQCFKEFKDIVSGYLLFLKFTLIIVWIIYLFISPYFIVFETTVVGSAVATTLPFHLFSSYFLFDPSFLQHFGEVK